MCMPRTDLGAWWLVYPNSARTHTWRSRVLTTELYKYLDVHYNLTNFTWGPNKWVIPTVIELVVSTLTSRYPQPVHDQKRPPATTGPETSSHIPFLETNGNSAKYEFTLTAHEVPLRSMLIAARTPTPVQTRGFRLTYILC